LCADAPLRSATESATWSPSARACCAACARRRSSSPATSQIPRRRVSA
jgi:hypothetical protein